MLSSRVLRRLSWRYVLLTLGLSVLILLFSHHNPGSVLSSGPVVELVVASVQGDDVSWLQEYLPHWKANVYSVDNKSAALITPVNKGREAMVYLTYLIDNYNKLPDISVFIHALRYQWHNDDPLYDGAALLQALQLNYVMSQGYVNLRCVWTLGCPAELHPHELNLRPAGDMAGETQEAYAAAFDALFPGKEVPRTVGAACCAQFAATRYKILERPLSDYQRFRHWLLTTELEDKISGRVLEYSWHQIFGMSPVHCPHAQRCYCLTYGLCNLTCAAADRCGDRWHYPPSSTLPEGWPEIGWQGEHRSLEELETARGTRP